MLMYDNYKTYQFAVALIVFLVPSIILRGVLASNAGMCEDVGFVWKGLVERQGLR